MSRRRASRDLPVTGNFVLTAKVEEATYRTVESLARREHTSRGEIVRKLLAHAIPLLRSRPTFVKDGSGTLIVSGWVSREPHQYTEAELNRLNTEEVE